MPVAELTCKFQVSSSVPIALKALSSVVFRLSSMRSDTVLVCKIDPPSSIPMHLFLFPKPLDWMRSAPIIYFCVSATHFAPQFCTLKDFNFVTTLEKKMWYL